MKHAWIAKPFLIALAGLSLAGFASWQGARMSAEKSASLKAISFSRIEGWAGDDHGAAFATFLRSCQKILGAGKSHPLKKVCQRAQGLGEAPGRAKARKFFEANFTPYRSRTDPLSGFVTGYFEPELKGARARSKRFSVPVYRAPDDLVQLFPDAERARRNNEMAAGRKTDAGMAPYYDRKEIEQGALEGRGLEILYLESWSDAFYMHVQGSGRVALKEGGHVRLSYAAKNGHSYTAIGTALIKSGAVPRDEMSMAAVRKWLDRNPKGARKLMWTNKSFIFFREAPPETAKRGPVGAQGVVLTPRRSLAVDTSIHTLGTPVWVNAPELDLHGAKSFAHLMVAQDAGSAIKGAQRGDIFWGSGAKAGAIAGATRHRSEFVILLPNTNPRN